VRYSHLPRHSRRRILSIPGKWLHHQRSSSSHDASPHPQDPLNSAFLDRVLPTPSAPHSSFGTDYATMQRALCSKVTRGLLWLAACSPPSHPTTQPAHEHPFVYDRRTPCPTQRTHARNRLLGAPSLGGLTEVFKSHLLQRTWRRCRITSSCRTTSRRAPPPPAAPAPPSCSACGCGPPRTVFVMMMHTRGRKRRA
jgi:hypothetical protein